MRRCIISLELFRDVAIEIDQDKFHPENRYATLGVDLVASATRVYRDASAKADTLNQICESRVAPQRIKEGMYFHELQHV